MTPSARTPRPLTPARGAVMWDLVEEHLDEAAFLGSQWEAALVSPRHDLRSVARGPEARLLAHLDGLLTAGAAARERLLEPALRAGAPDTAFAAALALLDAPGPAGLAAVLAALADAPRAAGAVARALGLAHRAGIAAELLPVAGGAGVAAAACLAALAFRRVEVPAESLSAGLRAQDAALQRAALVAARTRGHAVAPAVEALYASPLGDVAGAALETGLVLGLRSAWKACRAAVEARAPGADFAARALALGGDASDVERISAALGDPALRRAGLFALGCSGRAEAAHACLPWLDDGRWGPLAGEAFSVITGLALEGRYRREEVEGDADEPLEEDAPPAEAELPRPEGIPVARWWKEERARFEPGRRYRAGRPLDAPGLAAALRDGPMRWRPALALERAIRTGGAEDVETRTWAGDQLAAPAGRGPDPGTPFDALLRA